MINIREKGSNHDCKPRVLGSNPNQENGLFNTWPTQRKYYIKECTLLNTVLMKAFPSSLFTFEIESLPLCMEFT